MNWETVQKYRQVNVKTREIKHLLNLERYKQVKGDTIIQKK